MLTLGRKSKVKLVFFTGLLLVCWLGTGCAPDQDFDRRVRAIVKAHCFSIFGWELRTIPHEVGQLLFGSHEKVDDEKQLAYFMRYSLRFVG